ncbi:hypothetical protein [Spongorhabdus nitratireducens]
MNDFFACWKDPKNPFQSSSQLPIDYPILGKHLYSLAKSLNFSVMDACWFFGITNASWYEYSTNHYPKMEERHARELRKLFDESIRDGDFDSRVKRLNSKIQDEIESFREKEKKASRHPNKPINDISLSLLCRFFSVMPDWSSCITMKSPDIKKLDLLFKEAFKHIPDQAKAHSTCLEPCIGALLGRDKNAGYRWIQGVNQPHSTVKRLAHALIQWLSYESAGDICSAEISSEERTKRAYWWLALSQNEHKLLNREWGNGIQRG